MWSKHRVWLKKKRKHRLPPPRLPQRPCLHLLCIRESRRWRSFVSGRRLAIPKMLYQPDFGDTRGDMQYDSDQTAPKSRMKLNRLRPEVFIHCVFIMGFLIVLKEETCVTLPFFLKACNWLVILSLSQCITWWLFVREYQQHVALLLKIIVK